MRKAFLPVFLSLFLLGSLAACGGQAPAEGTSAPPDTTLTQPSGPAEAEGGGRILIAYFTRLDNTDGDLDTIVAAWVSELGQAVEGGEWIETLSGTVTFQKSNGGSE